MKSRTTTSEQISPALQYSLWNGEVKLSPLHKPQKVKGAISLTVTNLCERYSDGPFEILGMGEFNPTAVTIHLHPETAIKLARKILQDVEV